MSTNENNLHNGKQGFGLPGDYFQRSAKHIANKLEWEDEHRAYPLLLAQRHAPVFDVPGNYFLSSEQKLELTGLEKLAEIPKTNSFSVPADYFETLGTHLQAAQELQNLEALKTIAKNNSFKAPDGYFEKQAVLTQQLLAPKPRVIRLFTARTWYVAAALVVLALGFWAYQVSIKPVAPEDCGTIACLERIELLNTKTLERLDNDELYELVDSKELEKSLNAGAGKTPNTATSVDSSTQDDLIDDLPDGI